MTLAAPVIAVSSDRAARLIEITLAGFLGPADVDAFRHRRAHVQAELGGGAFDILADVSSLAIQSQSVLQSLADRLRCPLVRPDRIAVVLSRGLARQQILRTIGGHANVAAFETADAARRWLATPPVAA